MAQAMVGQWTKKAPYHTKEHMILSTSSLLLDDYKQYDHMYAQEDWILVRVFHHGGQPSKSHKTSRECGHWWTLWKYKLTPIFIHTSPYIYNFQLSSITFNITRHMFNSLVQKIKEGVLFLHPLHFRPSERKEAIGLIPNFKRRWNSKFSLKESFTWSSRQKYAKTFPHFVKISPSHCCLTYSLATPLINFASWS